MNRIIGVGLVSVGLFGCGVSTPDGLPDQSPTPTPGEGVAIEAIVPNQGPRGTSVEIQGKGFGTDLVGVEVRWGDEVISAESVADNLITVIAPDVGGGTVDIEVVTAEGSYKIESGFTYRGGYGGVVTIELLEYINPQQFNPPGQTSVYTYAALMKPEITPLKEIITGAVGSETCELNPVDPDADVEALDAGPQVMLTYNSFQLPIPKNTDFYYPDNASTDISGYLANVDYDISADGGTAADSLPQFVVQDAAPTAPSFTVTSPNVGGQFTIVSKSQDLTFNWTTNNPGDAFQIQLLAYKLTGGADDGLTGNELHCTAVDDGSFTIPATQLVQLTQATHVIILFSRRVDKEAVSIANQESTVEGLGYHTQVGALEFN